MEHPGTSHHLHHLQRQAMAVHEAFEKFGRSVDSGIQGLQRSIQKPFEEIASGAARAVHHLQQHLSTHLQGHGSQQLAFASVSAAHSQSSSAASRSINSLFDLAASPDEIKLRLSGIPVFAVVNNKNEFVLVSGDTDGDRQLGLFFFTKEDAEGLIATIKEQNPKLGKAAKVLATSMDAVYEFAVTPRGESGTEGVVFRFMPDGKQVDNALELYRHAGLPSASFTGVPLFQAEGLTVRGENARYTPLFFSKDDLDRALGDAYLARDNEAQADARAKADRARSELREAQTEVSTAAEGRAKRAAQKKADAAQRRVQKYEQQLAEATSKKSMPRVDVGCLEEVIVKMEADDKGEWSDVLFVPAGSLQGGSNGGQPKEGGKGKK